MAKIMIVQIKTRGSVSCRPRKLGVRKRSEHIDRKNKVTILTHTQLRDAMAERYQIYSEVALLTRNILKEIP